MRKQCIIVGLGKYGKTIAKKLANSKVEVLAVDSDMHILEEVSPYVTKAMCIDVTSEEAWNQLQVRQGEHHIRYGTSQVVAGKADLRNISMHHLLQRWKQHLPRPWPPDSFVHSCTDFCSARTFHNSNIRLASICENYDDFWI